MFPNQAAWVVFDNTGSHLFDNSSCISDRLEIFLEILLKNVLYPCARNCGRMKKDMSLSEN